MVPDDTLLENVQNLQRQLWHLAALLISGLEPEAKAAVTRLIAEAEHDVMRAVTAAGRHPSR